MGMSFEKLKETAQKESQERLVQSSQGEFVRGALATSPVLTPNEGAEVRELFPGEPVLPDPPENHEPLAEPEAAAPAVAETKPKPRKTKPKSTKADLITAVTTRRDPVIAVPTKDLHFHLDKPTQSRKREIEKHLRRERLGKLYFTSLFTMGLELCVADPAKWREAALSTSPIRGNSDASIRVRVPADLCEQLTDLADEWGDDDTHIPLARMARVAVTAAIAQLEETLGMASVEA